MASLSWPFNLSDVKGQFSGTTSSNVGNSMRSMYLKIFGSVTSGVSALSDFDGKGRPVADTLVPQKVSCSGGNVTVKLRANITDTGGLTTNYRFLYDTVATFDNNPTYTSSDSTSSTGEVSINVAGFTAGTDTVYCRVETWNAFNEDSTSDYTQDPNTENLVVTKGSLSTPSILSANHNFPDIYVEFSCDADHGSIQYQYRINGGSAQSGTVDCTAGLGTATAEAIFGTSGWTTGDTIEARVRLLGTACDNASAFSSWETTSSGFFSCPL